MIHPHQKKIVRTQSQIDACMEINIRAKPKLVVETESDMDC